MTAARILSTLRRSPAGMTLDELASALAVKRRGRAKLLEAVRRLEAAGDVRGSRGRFFAARRGQAVRGRFVTARRGFGFVRPETGGPDIFVPARYAREALPGDVVEVSLKDGGDPERPEGRIERIVTRTRPALIGVYRERHQAPLLQPFDSTSLDDIPLKSRGRLRPEPGAIVEVDRATLAVRRIIGRPEDPGVDTEVVIRRYGLRWEFSPEAAEEAARFPSALGTADLAGRKDFRRWATVTIDGETAQDFDDAVSIRRRRGGGWTVGVHIADVSHYVRPGTALDREAFERGTSVYFPGLTLPMLPEKLSNDLCSLRPREPRLTLSVLLTIDDRGRVVRSAFFPSVIRTSHRMTYTTVFKIFQGDPVERAAYADVVPSLLEMRRAADLLRERRAADGSLDFDLVEPELVYERGRLLAVAAAERNEAHRLIEEFMVAANVAVATALSDHGYPCLYRVHPPPLLSDLEKLREILFRFGLPLPEPDKVRSADLQGILERVRGRPEEKFVSIQVLRALKLAVYSPRNVGHYGLAKRTYAHFTSPIRRYPDLVVHRLLTGLLARRPADELPYEAIAEAASERERVADEAERALIEWRILRLLRERLGDEFAGVIVDVVKAGLVVELDGYFVSGLLPFSSLHGEYEPRPARRGRPSRRRRRSYELGDAVRVVLVACDPASRRMSFVPASEGKEEGP